jgi:hypothetical protein
METEEIKIVIRNTENKLRNVDVRRNHNRYEMLAEILVKARNELKRRK